MISETRILPIIVLSLTITGSVPAQAADAPYGTAKFAPYSDSVGGGVNSVVIGRFGIRAQKWGAPQRRNA